MPFVASTPTGGNRSAFKATTSATTKAKNVSADAPSERASGNQGNRECVQGCRALGVPGFLRGRVCDLPDRKIRPGRRDARVRHRSRAPSRAGNRASRCSLCEEATLKFGAALADASCKSRRKSSLAIERNYSNSGAERRDWTSCAPFRLRRTPTSSPGSTHPCPPMKPSGTASGSA